MNPRCVCGPRGPGRASRSRRGPDRKARQVGVQRVRFRHPTGAVARSVQARRRAAGVLPDGKASNVRVTVLARDGATSRPTSRPPLPSRTRSASSVLSSGYPRRGDRGFAAASHPTGGHPLMPAPQTESLQVEAHSARGVTLARFPRRSVHPARPGGFSVGAEGTAYTCHARSSGTPTRRGCPDQLAETRSTLVAWRSPVGREPLLRAPAETPKK
jgi:hypothetical protein